MFTQKELNAIDPIYFSIIALHGSAVTLQSNNTGHCWHILLEEYPRFRSCRIYHTNTDMELRFPTVSGRSDPMTPIGLAGKRLVGSAPGNTTKQTNRRYTHEQETYQSRIYQPPFRWFLHPGPENSDGGALAGRTWLFHRKYHCGRIWGRFPVYPPNDRNGTG